MHADTSWTSGNLWHPVTPSRLKTIKQREGEGERERETETERHRERESKNITRSGITLPTEGP